ncbi:hypothetical protein VP01_1445g1 [Puccinia sorghi]|uniref:Uncharacterized protein n=1 Tax=Puccinia sorghi TaxID=27349 RepID=A0A0L6VK43_9BASI|nr:hypothetical protein VP01_1445g1 [Puccinia sorghi]
MASKYDLAQITSRINTFLVVHHPQTPAHPGLGPRVNPSKNQELVMKSDSHSLPECTRSPPDACGPSPKRPILDQEQLHSPCHIHQADLASFISLLLMQNLLHCKKKLAQLPAVDMQKVPGSISLMHSHWADCTVTVPKIIHRKTCGVWMEAWLEHDACQLHAVAHVFFLQSWKFKYHKLNFLNTNRKKKSTISCVSLIFYQISRWGLEIKKSTQYIRGHFQALDFKCHNSFDMQKVTESFCCYSNLSPRVIQPSFNAHSLFSLHSDCAKTSTYTNRFILDGSLFGACCMSTAGELASLSCSDIYLPENGEKILISTSYGLNLDSSRILCLLHNNVEIWCFFFAFINCLNHWSNLFADFILNEKGTLGRIKYNKSTIRNQAIIKKSISSLMGPKRLLVKKKLVLKMIWSYLTPHMEALSQSFQTEKVDFKIFKLEFHKPIMDVFQEPEFKCFLLNWSYTEMIPFFLVLTYVKVPDFGEIGRKVILGGYLQNHTPSYLISRKKKELSIFPIRVSYGKETINTRAVSMALEFQCVHITFLNKLQVELRMTLVVTCVDFNLNNQPNVLPKSSCYHPSNMNNLESQPNIFCKPILSFSSSEDEPLPLPLSPTPVFRYAKATVSIFCLCIFLNEREETPLYRAVDLNPSSQQSVKNQNVVYIIKIISQLGYCSKNCDCIIAKAKFQPVYKRFLVEFQRISYNLIRTKFDKNKAKIGKSYSHPIPPLETSGNHKKKKCLTGPILSLDPYILGHPQTILPNLAHKYLSLFQPFYLEESSNMYTFPCYVKRGRFVPSKVGCAHCLHLGYGPSREIILIIESMLLCCTDCFSEGYASCGQRVFLYIMAANAKAKTQHNILCRWQEISGNIISGKESI